MLNSSEVEAMEQTCDLAMPDVLERLTPSWTVQADGGRVASWVPAGETPCRLAPKRSLDGAGGAVSEVAIGETFVLFPVAFVLESSDRALVNGELYQVLYVREPRAWGLSRLARVQRIEELS